MLTRPWSFLSWWEFGLGEWWWCWGGVCLSTNATRTKMAEKEMGDAACLSITWLLTGHNYLNTIRYDHYILSMHVVGLSSSRPGFLTTYQLIYPPCEKSLDRISQAGTAGPLIHSQPVQAPWVVHEAMCVTEVMWTQARCIMFYCTLDWVFVISNASFMNKLVDTKYG